jgi:hypothetical protein
MGLYEKWVLPRLLDLAMRNDILDYYRRRTIASARGQVLEIGVGSGLNLSLYGPAVGGIVGLDPSPELLDLAGKRAARALVPVSLVRASADDIPFADEAFDAIVMTGPCARSRIRLRRSQRCGGFSGRAGSCSSSSMVCRRKAELLAGSIK